VLMKLTSLMTLTSVRLFLAPLARSDAAIHGPLSPIYRICL